MSKEIEMLAIADALVEQLKENEQEIQKYKDLAKERVDMIIDLLQVKVNKLYSNNEGIKFELLQIANMSDLKETKTQRKLELLAGDVIIKKATKKFKNDNKLLLEALKESRPDLVKEKVMESLDWANYKKELKILDNQIVNVVTGEVVEVAGLEVENVAERVEVK